MRSDELDDATAQGGGVRCADSPDEQGTEMRASAGFVACLAAVAAVKARSSEPSPTYLRGYYKLHAHYLVWQPSDSLPWYVVMDAPWADPLLVKWGYAPVTHNAQNYYCVIDDGRPTGSHIPQRLFACGDPQTVELIYHNHVTPFGLSGGGPY